MKSLYLLVDIFTILVPFLFSFHPKLNFYKEWKYYIPANALVAMLFILWDMLYTDLGVWGFNPDYLLGIGIGNLPIEEILFFICIPYSCVFTFYCLNLFYKLELKPFIENCIVISISGILFIIGISNFNDLYTSSVFISLPLILILFKFVLRVEWLGKLLFIYPVLLIPFFIVNGILTGTGIDAPVVWYDDAENLGIRLLTIPIEDVFYGFELILLNIFLYTKFRNYGIKNLKEIPA